MMQSHSSGLRKFCLIILATITVIGMLLSLTQPVPVKASDPTPGPDDAQLARSYKAASKPFLKLGEVMTYTIHLEIGWSASLYGEVTDPIPAGLEYIPGSANYDGVYDPATRALTWNKVPVGYPDPVELTFKVKDIAQVNRPTPVVNTATITFNGFVFQRQAWVTLLPEPPVESDLAGSFKSSWPRMLGAGETVSYTITLINSGSSPVTVEVADPVPPILQYEPGSANHDGVFDPSTRTVIWKDVLVPPYSPLLPVEPIRLTFKAVAPNVLPASSIRPLVITNTAVISTSDFALKRSADILLVTYPIPPLEGSYKTASHRLVIPGQEFSYMIFLNNSSTVAQKASVKDPLPSEVSYVDGSANANGVYDPASHTVSWSNLTVLEGSTLLLTFKVVARNPVVNDLRIVNTAYISSGSRTLRRSVTILLGQSPGDHIPPVVNRFTIGEQDVNTNPEVNLHIAASDNIGVKWMYLREWVLATEPFPHWQQVAQSGWIPYQASYPWKLSLQSGTHFMGVWVADAARNRSKLTRTAIDFASLLLPGTHIPSGGMVPYLVYYPAGVEVKAELHTLTGAAHLFVWHPGSLFLPDDTSSIPDSDIQTITFTTRTAGIYMFLVYGLQPAVYNLRIAPGGGPRLPVPMPYNTSGPTGLSVGSLAGLPPSPAMDGITFNPILPQSGLDPLEIAVDPEGPYENIYLPAVTR